MKYQLKLIKYQFKLINYMTKMHFSTKLHSKSINYSKTNIGQDELNQMYYEDRLGWFKYICIYSKENLINEAFKPVRFYSKDCIERELKELSQRDDRYITIYFMEQMMINGRHNDANYIKWDNAIPSIIPSIIRHNLFYERNDLVKEFLKNHPEEYKILAEFATVKKKAELPSYFNPLLSKFDNNLMKEYTGEEFRTYFSLIQDKHYKYAYNIIRNITYLVSHNLIDKEFAFPYLKKAILHDNQAVLQHQSIKYFIRCLGLEKLINNSFFVLTQQQIYINSFWFMEDFTQFSYIQLINYFAEKNNNDIYVPEQDNRQVFYKLCLSVRKELRKEALKFKKANLNDVQDKKIINNNQADLEVLQDIKRKLEIKELEWNTAIKDVVSILFQNDFWYTDHKLVESIFYYHSDEYDVLCKFFKAPLRERYAKYSIFSQFSPKLVMQYTKDEVKKDLIDLFCYGKYKKIAHANLNKKIVSAMKYCVDHDVISFDTLFSILKDMVYKRSLLLNDHNEQVLKESLFEDKEGQYNELLQYQDKKSWHIVYEC